MASSSARARARRIFTEPIARIISSARAMVSGIVQWVKDAILRPLARLAEGTRGYDLLKAVLGRDPITGEAVPRNAETLIGGFMKLIGQEEIWNNLKRANAVSRAWAWFQGALGGLMGFVRQVPGLFLAALRSLEIADIVLLPRAFARVASAFGGFIGGFLMPALVFKSPPPDIELVESADRLLRDWGAKSPDLQFVSNGVVHQAPGVVVFMWTHVADANLIITVTLDDVRRARYLNVAAVDPDTRALLTAGLRRQLSTYSVEELLDAVRHEGASDPGAYVRLGMALDRHDDEASRLSRAGLESPEVEVRANAAMAVMHLRWPEFADPVFRARSRETDAGVGNLLEVSSRWYKPDPSS